ncbi:CvpA family protein [Hydrogenimonas cancrithermarum]|uniref:Colicin V biosynthesis protein n=1 Tax=Hydrogenimonas cancrithermarum TaxID=2993563 RepID=A0ABN6WTJ7_9BACT|nr:CvpA family protein [Hydrogenimonas cancrithermarum]BDY12288.1 colicin V biosynthesis protein [Hydrogenimonas cancrithermarum]
MEMNWFDIVTASLILLIGIKGIFNGLIKELAGLVGIVLGVWVASTYASDFGQWIGKSFLPLDSQSALAMIGFLALLTLIWLACIVAGVLVSKLVSLSGLGIIDKLLGLLFASAKVFIILSVIVFALSNIEIVKKNTEKFTAKSLLHPLFVKTGEFIVHIDTDDLLEKADGVKKRSEEAVKKGEKIVSQRSGNATREADETR